MDELGPGMPRARKPASAFRCFNSSSEVVRLMVLASVRFPLSLRKVEDLLFERGIDISHETVRHCLTRQCGTGGTGSGRCLRQTFAGSGVKRMRGFRSWKWHLDEMYVRLNSGMVIPLRRVTASRANRLPITSA
jgi:putative transposase